MKKVFTFNKNVIFQVLFPIIVLCLYVISSSSDALKSDSNSKDSFSNLREVSQERSLKDSEKYKPKDKKKKVSHEASAHSYRYNVQICF